MQVNSERELLVKAVHRTLGVVDKKGTLPILSHVLLKAEDGGITISATDLEVCCRVYCPAEVKEPGALALPAHYFHNLVKNLPGARLDLASRENHRLEIVADESRYHLMGLPPDQFPPFPEVAEESLVETEAAKLKEMVEKTIFCASGDSYQYSLSAVFCEVLEEAASLRMVTTDGHRLALVDRSFAQGESASFNGGVLIPRKGALELSRALDGQEKVGLALGEKQVALRANGQLLVVRLLDKSFPEYRRIIPETWETRFSFPRQALVEAVRRLSSLSTERFRGLAFTMGEGEAEIIFDSPEVGQGREVVEARLEAGDPEQLPLQLGFNAPYLLEALNPMKGERAFLEVNDKSRPCRFTGDDDPGYLCLVMPLDM
jgi:DNA polymerase-3 subunit beta